LTEGPKLIRYKKKIFPIAIGRKEEEMDKERMWSYKNLQIKEGLKPGSRHFQYFFVVSEGGKKKCNYCIWIDDENLTRFGPLKKYEEIVSSQREEWSKWVEKKIDQGDFRNLVLKLEKEGQKEVHLNEMEEKLKAE
jgi:hypothetical protein